VTTIQQWVEQRFAERLDEPSIREAVELGLTKPLTDEVIITMYATKPPADAESVERAAWEDACDQCGKFVSNGTGLSLCIPFQNGNITIAFVGALCQSCVDNFDKETL